MTIIFIENEFGNGQVVTIAETFRRQTFEYSLRPGENGRFLVCPFKSIIVNERSIVAAARDDAQPYASRQDHRPYALLEMPPRGHDG